MSEVKIGIIGTGVGLRTLAPGFVGTEKARISALAGSSKERAIELGSEYSCDIYTGDPRDIIDSDVDLVCVTTPNEFHLEHMKLALDSPKNVYLEKPTGINTEDAKKIEFWQGDKDRLVIVGHQLRFDPNFVSMKNLIGNGDLGRVYSIEMNYSAPWLSEKDLPWIWSLDETKGGGSRLALGVHFVDLARFLLDENPVAVSGLMDPVNFEKKLPNRTSKPISVSSYTSMSLVFNNVHVTINVYAHSFGGHKFNIVLHGDKADAIFGYGTPLTLSDGLSDKIVLSGSELQDYQNKTGHNIFRTAFNYYAQAIVETLAKGKSYLEGASLTVDAVQNMIILDALTKSCQEGKIIILDDWPDRFSKLI